MGKFEDDLKRVRLEEKFNSADWRGFLHMVDCNEAVKAFVKKNKNFFVMNWKAKNYKQFKRCLEFVNDHVYFPDAQSFFYSSITKFYIGNFKVEKKSAGFGHCRFVVKIVWPFVIYYRRVADVLSEIEIKSSEFAKMEGAKHNEIYCKEYHFEKEYSFEFAQCGKTPKWILNNIYLNFIHDRFYAITQQMNNAPKSIEEYYDSLQWFDVSKDLPPKGVELYIYSEHGYGKGHWGIRVKDGDRIWAVHLDSGECYLVYAYYKVYRWAYIPKM